MKEKKLAVSGWEPADNSRDLPQEAEVSFSEGRTRTPSTRPPLSPPRRPRTPLRSLPPGGAHGERPGRVRGARRPFQPQQPAVTRTQARATGSEPDVASCGDISDPGRVPRHRACPEPAPRRALSPTSAARAQGESQLLSWDPRWQAGPGSPRAGALCEPCTRCEPSPHSLCGPGHHTPKSPACVNVRRGLP